MVYLCALFFINRTLVYPISEIFSLEYSLKIWKEILLYPFVSRLCRGYTLEVGITVFLFLSFAANFMRAFPPTSKNPKYYPDHSRFDFRGIFSSHLHFLDLHRRKISPYGVFPYPWKIFFLFLLSFFLFPLFIMILLECPYNRQFLTFLASQKSR